MNLKGLMRQKSIGSKEKVAILKPLLTQGKTVVEEKHQELVADVIANTMAMDMATINENQAGFGTPSINTGLGTQPMAKTWNTTIPTLKRIMPDLLANDLCSVQSMDSPYSLVFVMKYFNEKAGHGFDSAKELYSPSNGYKESTTDKTGTALNFTDVAYSGFNSLEVHEAYNTQSGENLGGWLSDVYGTQQFEQVTIGFDVQEVKAQTNAIKSTLSLEFQTDLQNMRGEDAESILIDLMTKNVASDNDRIIIANIKRTAIEGAGGSGVEVIDMSGLSATSKARWQQEENSVLLQFLDRKSLQIQEDTYSGQGNWILANGSIVNAIKNTANMYSNAEFSMSKDSSSTTYKGTFNDMKLYMDLYSKEVTHGANTFNEVCIGLNGGQLGDAGLIFAPYVPLMIQKAPSPEDGQERIILKSRNGIVRNSLNGGAYYKAVAVANI